MEIIDIAEPSAGCRDRFFARSVGTSFNVRASTDVTEIDLYDQIGTWGVTARDFRAKLKDAGDITLRINSPGGDVFAGVAIYNDLVAHKGKVRVEVTGVAASIASIIAMAGSEIAIADNAFFMIHNSRTFTAGTSEELREIAAVLTKIDDAMSRTYASRTGTGIRSIKKMMDDETWMNGKEALEAGFATEITKSTEAKAKFDLSVFASMPEALKWPSADDSEPETERDLERAVMQDAGWSRSKWRAAKRIIKPNDEPLQDAGKVDLTALAAAVQAVSATFKH